MNAIHSVVHAKSTLVLVNPILLPKEMLLKKALPRTIHNALLLPQEEVLLKKEQLQRRETPRNALLLLREDVPKAEELHKSEEIMFQKLLLIPPVTYEIVHPPEEVPKATKFANMQETLRPIEPNGMAEKLPVWFSPCTSLMADPSSST